MSSTPIVPAGQFGYTGADQNNVPELIRMCKAAGVIAAGDIVSWVAVNTDVEATVEQTDVSDAAPNVIAGVALEAAAAAGDYIQVCRQGVCRVNIGAGTVAFGEVAGLHATTDGAADTADATEGGFGVFLGAEIGSTNQAFVDVTIGRRAADA